MSRAPARKRARSGSAARPGARRTRAAPAPARSATRAAAGAGAGQVRTGRVYDPPNGADGTRVLVMRKWPRGVRKERIDHWLRELGPVEPLMRAYLAGRVPWPEYRTRYLQGLERPEAQAALEELRELARRGPVTLLCWCADENRCHRSLLRDHLLGRL